MHLSSALCCKYSLTSFFMFGIKKPFDILSLPQKEISKPLDGIILILFLNIHL